LTKKGKGYRPAEKKPHEYHSTGPFDVKTGEKVKTRNRKPSFGSSFGKKLVEIARNDKSVVAVTAAMIDGTGLAQFAREFPDRCFDVGIAEGHAVGFAAGLAKGGLKPVVAIYSTFLQRGYDQIIHDVSLQDLPVVLCLDRAGLVGEDGPTHHGIFDIAYLRHIPNLVIMAPSSAAELEAMLEFAVKSKSPVSIRYPRGCSEMNVPVGAIELGRSQVVREGRDIAIFALGSMVATAIEVADRLKKHRADVEVINARFVKPIDGELLEKTLARIKKIVTIEEGVASGGFGSAVAEFIEREKIKNVTLEIVGLPDEFVEHGSRQELLNKYNMSAEGIENLIKTELL
jgi:1-deoxy-D-xylulose-5-phosphate synthase